MKQRTNTLSILLFLFFAAIGAMVTIAAHPMAPSADPVSNGDPDPLAGYPDEPNTDPQALPDMPFDPRHAAVMHELHGLHSRMNDLFQFAVDQALNRALDQAPPQDYQDQAKRFQEQAEENFRRSNQRNAAVDELSICMGRGQTLDQLAGTLAAVNPGDGPQDPLGQRSGQRSDVALLRDVLMATLGLLAGENYQRANELLNQLRS